MKDLWRVSWRDQQLQDGQRKVTRQLQNVIYESPWCSSPQINRRQKRGLRNRGATPGLR
jgi:hypothetical protein